MGTLFGTDGIRGKVGDKINGDIAYRLGNALGRRSCLIVVGRDTRISGEMLHEHLVKGIVEAGANVIELGVVPTPVVAYVTEHMSADFGVVITASHNSKDYNGLKVFSKAGAKLEHDDIESIESDMLGSAHISDTHGKMLDGRADIESYKKSLLAWFGEIEGLKVVLDPANGALSHFALDIFNKITNGVTAINNDGNGEIINENSGALHPETVALEVVRQGADVGFSFDGDGDRIIAVDEKGNIINGDLILYIIASYYKDMGMLDGDIAVGTCYSNAGVERALADKGITMLRSETGDSNVAELMRNKGAKIGAERSGHVIASHFTATGDGLLVALLLCTIMTKTGKKMSELADVYEYPMGSFDKVTDKAREIARDRELRALISELESDKARILLRPSGTEPKLRIMVESENKDMVDEIGAKICAFIKDKYNI